jgi:hypothetical protein
MPFAHWDKLLYGIERGDCVLFLGPELPVETPQGSTEVPLRSLARQLLHQLGDPSLAGLEPQPSDLAWIAQRFLVREDDVALEMQLAKWHGEWLERPSGVHDALAALPFRLVVTSGLDPLMESALRRAGKAPAVERYHYRGRNKELLPEPTITAPVLFHLYGCVNEPSSVVLTELQLLDFLARLIARDPPLPNDLNAALTHGRLFLFLGFDLRQWYLRILFHVLKVLRSDSRGFVMEALERTPGGETDHAILFYRDNFKIDVFGGDAGDFARELRDRFVASGGPQRLSIAAAGGGPPGSQPVPGGGVSVFICHASEDEEQARLVDDALKRARLEPWFDRDSLRGGDRWDDLIESTIGKVDFFVVLNSKALAAKSAETSYVNKEINLALEADKLRLTRRFIVPALIDDTPLLEPLRGYHAVDLRSPEGLVDLVRAIKRRTGTASFAA